MSDLQEIKKFIEEEIKKPVEVASVVEIVDKLILYGFLARASDIHFQPQEEYLVIRYRIDGLTHNTFFISKELQDEIIARLKILANLRIDEHFSAQDGRFRYYLPNQIEGVTFFDVRISIMPTYHGENAILRLLVNPGKKFTLENLGFSPQDLEKVRKAISKPYGMVLSTGPTGSGKTTLLYSILNELNREGVHIITIEDPIEYAISGLTQIQVNPQTNLTFAKGLRAILRQDPDIIMVGEIRDEETASIAVNAALTGHLLLSTLHTNDAPSAAIRLIELGIEPYLITSTVNAIIGQRLVRLICPHCQKEKPLKPKEKQTILELIHPLHRQNYEKLEVVKYGEGCEKCNFTGYLGRTGIYEVLDLTDEIRDLILEKSSSDEIKNKAIELGMTTMLEDGLSKVLQGLTTVEEVLRVSHE